PFRSWHRNDTSEDALYGRACSSHAFSNTHDKCPPLPFRGLLPCAVLICRRGPSERKSHLFQPRCGNTATCNMPCAARDMSALTAEIHPDTPRRIDKLVPSSLVP